MKLEFRDLRCDEIELRVGSTNEKGFQLLLYKDARVDMALLDEVVGVGNWQREHIILGNDIYCRLGIFNPELNTWIWKTDAGSSGSIEEEKSKASDSFKRAATNFGLGRCLYTAPFVWINKSDDNNPKTSRYFVKDIDYKEHKITKLVVCNEKSGEVVFSYPRNAKVSETGEKAPKKASNDPNQQKGSIRNVEKEVINSYLERLQGDNRDNFFKWLDKNFGTMSVDMLSAEQGVIVARRLMNNGKQ